MTIDQHIAAGIDLGSNTFRLLVASRTADKFKILAKKLATVRLGHGLAENQTLHDRPMEKGLEVLRGFRKIIDNYRPPKIRVCGTEALRMARNSHLFLKKAEKILQSKIDIITGEEEAHLSLMGVLSCWNESLPGNILLVDVGGGSTEFILADTSSGLTQVASTGMGVVGLTEKHLGSFQSDLETLDEELADNINNCLKELKISGQSSALNIVGCGGTATSMGGLDLNLASYNESMVHGHLLKYDAMEKLWNRLIVLPPEKRNEIPGLEEGRGQILPAGIRIYQVLLKILQLQEIRVSDSGLLEGILLSNFQDIAPLK